MLIRDQLRRQGEALFRRRNVLPALMLPLAALALWDSGWIERRYGRAADDAFEWLCLGVSLVGIALRVAVAGSVPRRTSGRHARKGMVADTLNTTGIYSVMRHPLYVANFAIFAGFLLTTTNLWPVVVGTLLFWLYYERIAFAEEEFLLRQFGDRYVAWAEATPAVVPRLRAWRRPDLPFSWRRAVRREYRTLCATLLAFAVLDLVEDALAHGRFELDAKTRLLLAVAAALFATIRLLDKRTRLLRVVDR